MRACNLLADSTSTSVDKVVKRPAGYPPSRTDEPRRLGWLPDDEFPSPQWRRHAEAFVDECQQRLHAPAGVQARAYLRRRGLKVTTLLAWHVGLQSSYRRYERGTYWELALERVYIPRGVVLPWSVDGQPAHIQVRTSSRDRLERYLTISGWHPRLFGGETLRAGAPAGLDPFWWTFLMSGAQPEENVHDDSASETHLHANLQGQDD